LKIEKIQMWPIFSDFHLVLKLFWHGFAADSFQNNVCKQTQHFPPNHATSFNKRFLVQVTRCIWPVMKSKIVTATQKRSSLGPALWQKTRQN
jgi:hypothetical protein